MTKIPDPVKKWILRKKKAAMPKPSPMPRSRPMPKPRPSGGHGGH